MTFTNYAEAQKWIAEGEANYGKKAFQSSAEYRAAYPAITALYAGEHGKRVRRQRVEMPLFGSSLLLHAAGLR